MAVAAGQDMSAVADFAYRDVLAAWRHYLARHNQGRPFVLIGHSQGTVHLTRLLADEIEGRPEAARMLSALLIGFSVEVPQGRLTGGSLQRTPLCTRAGETGCVITYVSFRADSPPTRAPTTSPATSASWASSRPAGDTSRRHASRLGRPDRSGGGAARRLFRPRPPALNAETARFVSGSFYGVPASPRRG